MSREMKAIDPTRAEASLPARTALPQAPDSDEGTPAQFFLTLFRARLLVGAVTVAFVFAGAVYLAVAVPIYRSDIIVQVEEPTKSIVGLSELPAALRDGSPAETEMEIIRSRSLLETVVETVGLEIAATPVLMPILGGAIARRHGSSKPAKPMLGLVRYAWGGERIRVRRLDVPDQLLDTELLLTAGEHGAYSVRAPSGVVLTGEVGKAAAGGDRGRRIEMFVSDLVARPGTRFIVTRRSLLQVVKDLQAGLRITEQGKSTGVMRIALEDPDPKRAAAILDEIAATYVRQNVERKSAEAAKTLAFLETQLPTLKANLGATEAALKGYQVQKGTLDLSREAKALMERSVAIERAVSEAELQRSDLRHRFTESHPALLSLSDKIEKLRAERGANTEKMRDLPGTELDSARLSRDVKVARELYDVLINKAQELRVVKSGTIGNVRVLDRAIVPDRPVRPSREPVLLLSMLLGFAIGSASALTRKSLYSGLDDPEMVERLTGISVYATVPRSSKQAALAFKDHGRAQPSLAEVEPGDPAVESVRSLQTGLQFALLEAKNNVLVITGPTAGVGKSFLAVNLAHVVAAAERRVLLVDADLRRGRLHKSFGASRSPGLSDVVSGVAIIADAVRRTSRENLHVLPTGRIPPDPAELLGSERFARVIADLAADYDVVIVDTAPILPVTDAALIARQAGTTLLVLRAGAHPVGEVLVAVKRLTRNGARVKGAVLNDVSGAGARYSRFGYQYKYDSRA